MSQKHHLASRWNRPRLWWFAWHRIITANERMIENSRLTRKHVVCDHVIYVRSCCILWGGQFCVPKLIHPFLIPKNLTPVRIRTAFFFCRAQLFMLKFKRNFNIVFGDGCVACRHRWISGICFTLTYTVECMGIVKGDPPGTHPRT